MEQERRKIECQLTREKERDLNPEQLAALRTFEHFGWDLKFVRRPMFQDPIPIMYDADTDKFVVLREDGTLDEDHDLIIRP